jgi:hypothetical protein
MSRSLGWDKSSSKSRHSAHLPIDECPEFRYQFALMLRTATAKRKQGYCRFGKIFPSAGYAEENCSPNPRF